MPETLAADAAEEAVRAPMSIAPPVDKLLMKSLPVFPELGAFAFVYN